jgi:hypothetical protein
VGGYWGDIREIWAISDDKNRISRRIYCLNSYKKYSNFDLIVIVIPAQAGIHEWVVRRDF